MNIGKAITDAWNIYLKHFIIIFLAGILASILGILIAPMVGFQTMFLKAQRGEAISFGDIFAPFNRFFSIFFGAIWIGIVVLLLFVPAVICFSLNWNAAGAVLVAAAILGVIYLSVSWVFALLMIYDKGLSIGAALSASRALVAKNNFWLHLALVIVASIIGALGNLLWGIGVLLTFPLGVGMIVCAYAEEVK